MSSFPRIAFSFLYSCRFGSSFVGLYVSVSRRSRLRNVGRKLAEKSSDGCHGPVHDARPATWPNDRVRRSDAEPESSRRMPLAIAVSAVVAGSKTNAWSLRAP